MSANLLRLKAGIAPKNGRGSPREAGLEPAQSTSRNPLEQPWSLPPEEFTCLRRRFGRQARRAPRPDLKKFTPAHNETAALIAQIQKIEQEIIDQRVAALYGL
jgi:hypothetical protein